MEIIQPNNGTEEAQNSSTQNRVKAARNARPDEFYSNSFYMAAIAVSLGHAGVFPALTVTTGGGDYDFDFYHPESQTYFKVFRDNDLQEYRRYVKFSRTRILIIDINYVNGALGYRRPKVGPVVILPKAVGDEIYQDKQTLLYFEGRLWEPYDNSRDEWTEWRLLESVARRK